MSVSLPVQLTAQQFLGHLHPGKRFGRFFFRADADNEHLGWQGIDPTARSLLPAEWKHDAPARFVTPCEFEKWVKTENVSSFSACFVDVDNCADLSKVVSRLNAHCVPHPSIVVRSGNGLHLYWLLRRAPRDAMPSWRGIQTRLHQVLEDLDPPFVAADGKLKRIGSDPSSRSCTKNLRLVGSMTKRGSVVTAELFDDRRYSVRELEKVLGTRPKYSSGQRAARPNAKPVTYKGLGIFPTHEKIEAAKSPRPLRCFTSSRCRWSRYYGLIECDLALICAANVGQLEGYRDTILHLWASAAAWTHEPGEIRDYVLGMADIYMPGYRREVGASLNQTIERATRASMGETVVYRGATWDPRYTYSPGKMREMLRPLITRFPSLEKELRVLFDRNDPETQKTRRRDSRNKQNKNRRELRAKLAVREAYLAHVDLCMNIRAAEATTLRGQGLLMSEIAKRLQCSVATVSRLLRRLQSPAADSPPPAAAAPRVHIPVAVNSGIHLLPVLMWPGVGARRGRKRSSQYKIHAAAHRLALQELIPEGGRYARC